MKVLVKRSYGLKKKYSHTSIYECHATWSTFEKWVDCEGSDFITALFCIWTQKRKPILKGSEDEAIGQAS